RRRPAVRRVFTGPPARLCGRRRRAARSLPSRRIRVRQSATSDHLDRHPQRPSPGTPQRVPGGRAPDALDQPPAAAVLRRSALATAPPSGRCGGAAAERTQLAGRMLAPPRRYTAATRRRGPGPAENSRRTAQQVPLGAAAEPLTSLISPRLSAG